MARDARQKFPYSIECKNQEKINLWESYEQAKQNSKTYEPIVVMKRNNSKPLVLEDAEYFVSLHKKNNNNNGSSDAKNENVQILERSGS